MAVTMRLNLQPLKKFQRVVGVATSRAINKSSVSVRAVGSRALSQDLALRVGDVRKELVLTRATAQTQEARISVRGRRLPLILFGATGPQPSRGRGRGVSYRFGRGRKRIASAFIATMRSGHKGVFRRILKASLPIVELFGPSLAVAFTRRGVKKAMTDRYAEVMPKNLQHEILFELQRVAKRL